MSHKDKKESSRTIKLTLCPGNQTTPKPKQRSLLPYINQLEINTPELLTLIFPTQIWFYTNDIFENAGIPAPEIQYTTAGTGVIEIIAGLVGVKLSRSSVSGWRRIGSRL